MTNSTEDGFDPDALRREIVDVLDREAGRSDGTAPSRDAADSDRISLPVVSAMSHEEEVAALAAARRFQSVLFDAGLAWLSGPPELGGRGLPSSSERLFTHLVGQYDVPDRSLLRTGTRIIAPSIYEFGSPELSAEVLPTIYRGDLIACQLFSEPDAGSDLANVATRAEREGDVWRLTGQKVWSSGAHLADVGACLARTSSTTPKHRGLTMFLIELDQPGVEVRPIKQMTGGSEFDEVFLDEAEVNDARRVGEVDGGWAVALHMLMNERSAIGDELLPDRAVVDRLVELCSAPDVPTDLQLEAADVIARMSTTRWMVDETLAGLEDGGSPGPELAASKLCITDDVMRISSLVTDVLAGRLVADTGEPSTFAWTEFLLGVHGLRVGGGTDEVLLNTIGERVLDLPREPRAR